MYRKVESGVAFDVGTTTIVGSMVNLKTGETLKTFSLLNPQIELGRDVLSRVEAVRKDEGILRDLHNKVVEAINRIINFLLKGNGDLENIVKGVFVGNPVMEHLLLSLSPVSMGRAPYKPLFKEGKRLYPGDLGLHLSPSTFIYVFPLIGGFVGGDTISLILHAALYKRERVRLAIDIGTNTEIVLTTPEGIWVTSTPAGPAFEGGGIRNGMMAEEGAISVVSMDEEKVEFKVIGGRNPVGICGSGLIDAISEMVMKGIIDQKGRIRERDEIEGNLANRVNEAERGNSFLLYRDAKREISIDQNDIREVQLAKGAIQAGIKVLLNRRKLRAEEIEEVVVTGAFGNHISPRSLQTIGIIPGVWMDRITFIDDAPLLGAKSALLSHEAIEMAEKVAREAHYTPLSGNPIFETEFLRGMNFDGHKFWEV